MSKKLSSALLIPTISLLPFTQVNAFHESEHPETPSHHVINHTRHMVIRGKMVNASTIQISTAELAKLNQPNAMRVITLMDDQNHKQRFMLLTVNRSNLARDLMDHHGHLKEFRFYNVVDENGNNIHLLASKRIMTAPANQLTAVFDSTADAQRFFNQTQKILAAESIVLTNSSMNSTEANEMSKEISQINNTVSYEAHEQSKSKVIEPIDLFPTLSLMVISTVLVTHSEMPPV